MATIVYIDGFNLYYGSLKRPGCKWLDLEALCSVLLRGDNVVKIRYYTARVRGTPGSQGAPQRQQVYLRALETLPLVEIHYGHFLIHPVMLPLVKPPASGSRMAHVLKPEEKGSDVNLATHLVVDGFRKRYDAAVVVSNDSDLAEPIAQVKKELGVRVGVLNPHARKRRSAKLASVGPDFHRQITRSTFAQASCPTLFLTVKVARSTSRRAGEGPQCSGGPPMAGLSTQPPRRTEGIRLDRRYLESPREQPHAPRNMCRSGAQ